MENIVNINNFQHLKRNIKQQVFKGIKLLCVFGYYGSEVVFVTNEDQVFGFGYNRHGCLGIGVYDNNVYKPKKIEELCNKEVINISYGITHCLALTKSGLIYSWGGNQFGQLGNQTFTNSNRPQLVKELIGKYITQICCGYDHSMALTREGQLYCWGHNHYGQIGDKSYENRSTPVLVFNAERVVSMSCGVNHTMVVTEPGIVYIWGHNSYGQLGRKQRINEKTGKPKCLSRNIPFPLEMSEIHAIKKGVCGGDHSLIITSDGTLYAFGRNGFGQIGNDSEEDQYFPIRIGEDILFKDIVSSFQSNFSIALSIDNKCYIWGECGYEVITTPKEIPIDSFHNLFAIYSKFKTTYKAIVIEDMNQSHEMIELLNESHSFLSISSRNPFLECLNQSFNNPSDYDIIFRFKDKLIYGHKTILRIRNKKFWRKCETHLNKDINEIRVKSYSYKIMYSFIEYLYTNNFNLEEESPFDLLILANIYGEEDLKLKCSEIMRSHISIENVCALYLSSVKHGLQELEKHCIEFVSNNWKIVCKSDAFQEMSESLSKKLILSSIKC